MIEQESAQTDSQPAPRHDAPSMSLVRRVEHIDVTPATVIVEHTSFVEETHAVEMMKLEVNVTASKKEAGYTIGYTFPSKRWRETLEEVGEFDKVFFTKTFPGGKSRNAGAS